MNTIQVLMKIMSNFIAFYDKAIAPSSTFDFVCYLKFMRIFVVTTKCTLAAFYL